MDICREAAADRVISLVFLQKRKEIKALAVNTPEAVLFSALRVDFWLLP
jgi:hypothetical protein